MPSDATIPKLDQTDPRLGSALLTTQQIAERLRISRDAAALRLRATGIPPVGRTVTGTGAHIYWWPRHALDTLAATPAGVDPDSEVWLNDVAPWPFQPTSRERIQELSAAFVVAVDDGRLANAFPERRHLIDPEIGRRAPSLESREVRDSMSRFGLVRRASRTWIAHRELLSRFLEMPPPAAQSAGARHWHTATAETELADDEILLRDLAAERGVSSNNISLALATRLRDPNEPGIGSQTLNKTMPRVAAAGLARQCEGRWVVRADACRALLDDPGYDPATECTLAELFSEVDAFSNPANLGRFLRNESIPTRRVVIQTGATVVVVDRDAALAAIESRRRRPNSPRSLHGPRLGPCLPSIINDDPEAHLRQHIGPFRLAAPTYRETIDATIAAWLLDDRPTALRTAARADPTMRVPGSPRDAIAITWLERVMVEREDVTGLHLLAAIVDGHLQPRPDLSRIEAVLLLS